MNNYQSYEKISKTTGLNIKTISKYGKETGLKGETLEKYLRANIMNGTNQNIDNLSMKNKGLMKYEINDNIPILLRDCYITFNHIIDEMEKDISNSYFLKLAKALFSQSIVIEKLEKSYNYAIEDEDSAIDD